MPYHARSVHEKIFCSATYKLHYIIVQINHIYRYRYIRPLNIMALAVLTKSVLSLSAIGVLCALLGVLLLVSLQLMCIRRKYSHIPSPPMMRFTLILEYNVCTTC